MKRRIVSVLMALVMALSLLPVQALAEDAAVGEPVTEGRAKSPATRRRSRSRGSRRSLCGNLYRERRS